MPIQNLYQSPAGSNGNDGALPAAYVPGWQAYTNLTTPQIAAFQAFPQDLTIYASSRRWLAEISGTSVTYAPTGAAAPVTIPLDTGDRSKTLLIGLRQAADDGLVTSTAFADTAGNFHTVDAAGIKAVHQAVMSFVQALFMAQTQLAAGIKAKPPTISTRSQIDAAYGSLAPNSVSATNPAK
jgi:hypothetical protein